MSVCELGRVLRMACPDWPSMQEREPQMMEIGIVGLIIPTRCIMGRWAQPYGTVMFLNAVSPLCGGNGVTFVHLIHLKNLFELLVKRFALPVVFE